MTLSKKVRLIVPDSLKESFFKHCGASRFSYNWALMKDTDLNFYGKESDIRKNFTQFKKLEENKWTNEVNNDALKQGIRDYFEAKSKYLKKQSKGKPRLKKKNHSFGSFYIDVLKIKIRENHEVYIPSIGWIKYSGYDLPLYGKKTIDKKVLFLGEKPSNPRVTWDGLNFYLSVSYEVEEQPTNINKGLSYGIDLGLKTFAVICKNDANSKNYDLIEVKSLKPKFKKLSKRKKRVDRKINKHNLKNKKERKVTKSKNYFKLLKKHTKLTHKMTNIQKDLIYKTVSDMVKTKPEKIVIEDLNVSGMMRNKRLAKWIQFNQFYNFRRILEYKCKLHGINLVITDRFYPSSKTCNYCGNIKEKLSLSERTYTCDCCGNEIDRDWNAAINLSNYSC